MSEYVPTRDEAYQLFLEYNSSDSLIKHALGVEGVMRYFARKNGEDEEKWGIIGLIHDIDYEKYPEEHLARAREILAGHSWPEGYIRAVESHGWGICTDVEPLSRMEKMLYAVDELTGFIVAVALVRPSKSVLDLKVKSVMKKWKDKRFAAGADRQVIEKGAALLGMELHDLIGDTILGMREVAAAIGLQGDEPR